MYSTSIFIKSKNELKGSYSEFTKMEKEKKIFFEESYYFLGSDKVEFIILLFINKKIKGQTPRKKLIEQSLVVKMERK